MKCGEKIWKIIECNRMQKNNSQHKDEKIEQLIKNLAATFVQQESNRISLITVTNVILGDLAKRATILFTVMPEHKQDEALDFLKRKRGEFQDYVRNNSRIGRVPLFDFALDIGEKNRQKLDNLLNS